jgi:neutral ceramidase
MRHTLFVCIAILLSGCPTTAPEDSASDAGADTGPPVPLSTDHCTYAPLPATARAGGTVTAGAIRVGLAELALDLPVGTALGGNTSRAAPLDNQGVVDEREVPLSGSFTPSVGVESIPKVKAIAITAGDETIVILRTDTIFGDDGITHEVTERLGPELAGKVLWASSHTHTGPAQYTGDLKLQVGGGPTSATVRARLIDRMVEAAELALAAREPARIGIATDEDFDPMNRVSYDRRPENDDLFAGEERKDRRLALIRIDRMDGTPMAILPLFGVHSAILDDDVSVYSTDASGAFERQLEEAFDDEVMVVHLQGAAGDVLGASDEHVSFGEGEPLWDFARNEECARHALPELLDAWERAGAVMESELAMEMVTRSVPLGPNWETFTVRDGALSYAPWDGRRACDRAVFSSDGAVLSPIDEFNAPAGAALCGETEAPLIPRSDLPNAEELVGYGSCSQLQIATRLLGPLLDFEFGEQPLCPATRTTVGALRLGDYLFGLVPGEPVVLFRDTLVAGSPFPPERTFVIGYALGHEGYLLTPEDWLRGGFEPSINVWGPLEGQYVLERIDELLDLAVSDAREDAAAGGVDRVVPFLPFDRAEPPDPAPMAGTIPTEVPSEVYFRGRMTPPSGQPAATIPRVTGVARFAWIGEDPLGGTPRVTLQREVGGTFEPVRRRSGRAVVDLDMILVWTPQPLADRGPPRTHYWTVEWQAVAGIGAPGLPALEDRVGLPLGRYRFHVEGTGYTIDSDAFEVVAGPIEVRATPGASIAIEARYQPAEGWRLLAMEGLSNRDVLVAAGPLSVDIEYASGAPETLEVPLSAPGMASVTPTRSETVTRVVVRDRFGNVGTATF